MIEFDDTVRLLSQFIQVDTSNPPGNEEAACQFLESLLEKEGIAAEIYSAAPARGNILARLKGKKPGEPIVLLGHLDVVPAHGEGWVVPPFSGAIRDGFLYGRGAIDMKAQVLCQLFAFINLHREGITPERDVIFLATCDEETGGAKGAEYMLGRVEDLGDAAFVLSEGGAIVEEDGMTHAQVSVAEKKISQFMLRARGTGGHASMPHRDNANDKIIRAANRVTSWSIPFRPTKIVKRYLEGVLKGKKVKGHSFNRLSEALRDPGFRAFIENHPVYNALLRNTVTLTILKSGEKVNVIPTESVAYFDARILPDEEPNRFLQRVAKVAGPEVEVILTERSESIPSSYNTQYFRTIAGVVRRMKRKTPVLPFLTTGATDLRYFRSLGILAYGFFPITLSKEEHLRMHGINERISLQNLRQGLQGTWEIVQQLAAYSPPV